MLMFKFKYRELCIHFSILVSTLFSVGCDKEDTLIRQITPNSIIVVPDIQNYTTSPGSDCLESIVDFINYNRYNISMCLQTGDLTNNNASDQWNNVLNEYVYRLDPGIPHCECLGNHDYGQNGLTNERVSNIPWDISEDSEISYGEYNENYVHFFQCNNEKYGVLVLEFAVRQSTLEWAQGILEQYPETKFILLTHAFLNAEGNTYSNSTIMKDYDHPKLYGIASSETADSDQIFSSLCNFYSNVRYIICGHSLPKDGFCVKTQISAYGDEVKLILINFQHFANGGDGNIAILNMDKDQIDIYSARKKRIINSVVL